MSDPTMSTSASNASVVDLQLVSRFWSEFDLEGMRPSLDEVGMRIAEHQEEAMGNRKKLAESTKAFRSQHADDPNTKAYGALLKTYQEEIDRLTKRAKHGEGAFLNIYQKLFEAPDPAPALSSAFETASRTTELEAQLRKVSQELSEYKAESTQIKNQDLTIRKLEEKVRALEAHADEVDREADEARQKAAAEADAARMAQMQQREAELSAMLMQAENSLSTMQKLHQASQNQLFAIQSASEERSAGRQSELELASEELERATDRLAALEREKHQLAQRLAEQQDKNVAVPAAGAPAPPNVEESLRSELGLQREVSARLRSEVASVKQELDEAHSMWESRLEGLKATLQATEQHAQALERELSMRPTSRLVEDLRHQIRMLQAVSYNTVEDEEDEEDGRDGDGAVSFTLSGRGSSSGTRGGNPAAGGAGSMEAALLQKNRHLEHELTMSRLKGVDVRTELDSAIGRLNDLEGQLAERQLLIDRLEEDLMASRSGRVSSQGGAPGKASSSKLSGLVSGGGSGRGIADTSGGDGEDTQQDSSMLRVLCSQRDRFRQKAIELEEELSKVRAELSVSKSEAAAARADNVALVERLRFVHGYKGSGQQIRAGSKDMEAGGGGGGSGADVERRYMRIYEEGINPFKEFQGQQRERQKQSMGVADRAMYKFGQLVFGSQSVRLFTFVYLLVLHLLVFGSLVRMTHHSSNQLYEHQQSVLDSRHDATGVLHHELTAVAPRLP